MIPSFIEYALQMGILIDISRDLQQIRKPKRNFKTQSNIPVPKTL